MRINLDKLIDQLADERDQAKALGYAQKPEDAAFLLALLFEDVRRNPDRYANR